MSMVDVAGFVLYVFMANVYRVLADGEDLSTSPPDDKEYNDGDYLKNVTNSKNMYRMLVVLITVTVVAIGFFVFKAISGRRTRKTKKYGVLATSGNDVELQRLEDDDDDDEDETVFDVNR